MILHELTAKKAGEKRQEEYENHEGAQRVSFHSFVSLSCSFN
jgi:hypothetical protein